MKVSQPPLADFPQCNICRAALKPGDTFCARCGARVGAAEREELRGVLYLLSELARWEEGGVLSVEQANALRGRYEARREALSAQLAGNGDQSKSSQPNEANTLASTPPTIPLTEQGSTKPATEHPYKPSTTANIGDHQYVAFPTTPVRPPAPALAQPFADSTQSQRRTLVESATDPRNIRLLLYTGAAMLVVGIVIGLRDVLYLKLQEPVVQAALLATGTLLVTASGWYTILRTRQRLTGRALTLIGSLLVPINFWFLVRSGLISNNGRAWVVCALCTLLYAHTALFLRERLYVYLASAASVATVWALIFRAEREAFGLYALAMMAASLIFLHLSRLFPRNRNEAGEKTVDDEDGQAEVERAVQASRWSYELWGAPLVHAALVGATLCALAYMPLRLWPSPSLYDGVFRLRANTYDSSIAMLLFAAGAYVLWFVGRYVYSSRARFLYTFSALALFWTEFLALDGLRVASATQILVLNASALVVALAARRARSDVMAKALHYACLLVSVWLALLSLILLQSDPALTVTHSAALSFIAATFAVLSAPRFCGRVLQNLLAYGSALFASIAFLVALLSADVRSETFMSVAYSLWPFVLYAIAQLARRLRRETQIVAPFIRTADASFVLLLLSASLSALFLHVMADRPLGVLRPWVFYPLTAATLYGVLRGARERSLFATALASLSAIVLVASVLDAFRAFGLWPNAWPIAAGVVCAAFLIGVASRYLLEDKNRPVEDKNEAVEDRNESISSGKGQMDSTVHLVMDVAVIICAFIWFVTSLLTIPDGGFGAASVTLLALLYWTERAARARTKMRASFAITHAGAFLITLLIALRVDTQWFSSLFVLILFPLLFALTRRARAREAFWLSEPASFAATATLMLASFAAIIQAGPQLQVGNQALLAPIVTVGIVALASFAASLFAKGLARVNYFRAGLSAAVVSFALACLRAGYEPTTDVEIFTSPVAILLLTIAYLSLRRDWDEYKSDTGLLLWMGSLLLSVPLLLHALQFRLVLDTPAMWRDMGTLCASLALVLFGVIGRLRAPVLVGGTALAAELAALALTSVDWTQVPLKIYLVTVGALIVFIAWMLEFRREQLLVMRRRFHERREYARERFGQWR